MNHVLLGAVLPFALGILFYVVKGCRASMLQLIITPLLMITGACWAVAPDLPRLLGMTELYNRLAYNQRCDIFLWHYSIDQVETDGGWSGTGLLIMVTLLLYAAWREILLSERGK